MSWVRVDERMRIWEASREYKDGWTRVNEDMEDWALLDEGVPVYKMTEDGRVARRTDQEIKRDKRKKS